MRQTAAIFLDAYRELNARKLFWVTLILSGLVVVAFAALGNNDKGMTIFHWTIEVPMMSTKTVSHADFYKMWFVSLGLKFWLGWIATILALISTASMIPDFLAGGAIELSLSKPIGRVRLFLTKYAAGLLFVALQVLVFTTACFLVIGIRGGAWEPGLFLAVPMVVLVFSFLFAICALAGVLTRSTIASLLITLLMWFAIFLVNSSEETLHYFRTASEVRLEKRLSTIETLQKDVSSPQAPTEAESSERAAEDSESDSEPAVAGLTRKKERIEELSGKLDENRSTARMLARIHRGVFAAKTLLPKTQESIGLLDRWLMDSADLDKFSEASADHNDQQRQKFDRDGDPLERVIERETEVRIRKEAQRRSVAWVLGTSIAFEGVLLSIAAWLFARRDF